MIKINEENIEISGITPVVATEAAMMMSALNDIDKTIVPIALGAVCTKAGELSLKEALSKFKEISDIALKKIEHSYKSKGVM